MSTLELTESRYDRQARITWWDQDVLSGSSVLVVGAGALGNEIVKNLALVGVGRIDVIDMDTVEHSNLARCVFFRDDDTGSPKAEVVAARAADVNPEVRISSIVGNVMALGLGRLRDYDLVIAGLDNREARAWVNQATRKLGIAWIDGAIEGLRGIARVFLPEGPCYECTLGEVDRKILAERRSCALLTTGEMLGGKVPTTATTGSVVAGLEVQEAIKLLHGRRDLLALANRAFVFYGETLESYLVDYSEDPECLAHDSYQALVDEPVDSATSLRDLARPVDPGAGSSAIDLEEEVVVSAACDPCEQSLVVRKLASQLTADLADCPSCHEVMRFELRQSLSPDDELAALPVTDLGLADGHVVTIRNGMDRTHLVLRTEGVTR